MSTDPTESFWYIDTFLPYIGQARNLAELAHEFDHETTDGFAAPYHRNTLGVLSALNSQFAGPGIWGEPWPAFPLFPNIRWWRWYAPAPPPPPGGGHGAQLPPPLRMRQRDDGLGTFDGHARLSNRQGANRATSGQLAGARVGARNLYDSGGPARPEGSAP